MFYEKMIEIVVKFLLNMIFGEEKRAKIRHFGAKNGLNMSWILPILLILVFHEMLYSCIFKKPRIWQVFLYMTWYGKHIRKKYRWRQVLWADALIQMPRKTPERNLIVRGNKSRNEYKQVNLSVLKWTLHNLWVPTVTLLPSRSLISAVFRSTSGSGWGWLDCLVP